MRELFAATLIGSFLASALPPAGVPVALAARPIEAAPQAAVAELTDAWDAILRQYVDGEGLVDYARLQQDRSAFEAFMRRLASADPDGLDSDADRIAFWINAYNAVVMWQVVERYPVDSVRDVGLLWGLVGGFFKQQYTVAGKEMSADDIEHGVLRGRFTDERIHWALVCAAFGCPRLLGHAYRAENLDATLHERALEFLAQPRGLQIDRASSTLYLSSYFDWYAGDFEKVAPSVTDYVLRYAPADAGEWIRANRDTLRIRFMEYDWTLNSQANGPRSRRVVPR